MTTTSALETKGSADLGFALDDLLRAFETYKEENDRRIADVETRGAADPLTTDKLDRLDRALDDHKRRLDEMTLKAARPPLGSGAPRSHHAREHKAAFDGYIRKGEATGLLELEGKALSVGSGPDGGYLVPVETEASVNMALKEISPIRAIASVRQVSGSVYKKPFSTAGAGTGWVGGAAERPETTTPTLAELSFPTTELYAMPAATGALLDDSAVDIDQWIAEEVRSAFAEQEGTAFVVGTGTNMPTGFMHYDKIANASWEWGKIGSIKTGVDAAFPSTNPGDKLIDFVYTITRATAPLVSTHDGRAAYGGTPSDQTVVAAIADLKERGHAVTLNPFILMDVPHDNALDNPYDPGTTQPAYPWRGRITVDPAPLVDGSPDKTSVAADQIAAFVGTATPDDFSIVGQQVVYSGPAEWSFRHMILHYAHLAVAVGGVDGFILCSELRGLGQVRAAASDYPFVSALVALAADVRAVLGPDTKITYGADWSEYFGHHPQDGSGDVYFHLDPLWASPDIDAIGIDAYWPLADWRDGREHLDWQNGHRSAHDLAYLKSNILGGEGYDWYYASSADRDAQLRTPITDGASKPWIFRYKDIRSWWTNEHYNRPGGIESATPTAWVPQSKPIWFTETGCPAIDRGANQPNVFVDPKSSESLQPYYSNGTRDDLIQRLYLQALIEGLDPAHPGYIDGANPTSTVYDAPMVDLAHVYVYAWDARPYPAFPNNTLAWGDGASWRLGHWLNGRIASQPLAATVRDILLAQGFDALDVGRLNGVVAGYVIDRIMSARDALQPLELAYFFDTIESEGRIVFRHRGIDPPVLLLETDQLAELRAGADLATLTRGQETDLPASARIAYAASESDYRRAIAEARRLVGASGRTSLAELPIVMEADQATQIAESWLFETWAARDRAQFALPPSLIAIEPGDVIALAGPGDPRHYRVTEIGDHGAREIDAIRIEPDVYAPIPATSRIPPTPPVSPSGAPAAAFLDLPLLLGSEPPETGYFAAMLRPWPGAVALYQSPETSGFTLRTFATQPATMGATLDDLAAGPSSRLDKGARFRVRLDYGALTSVSDLALLSGANAAAIERAPGTWEVIQFRNAALVAPATYELSTLLRGQQGTEATISTSLAAGARFVLLDAALTAIDLTADEIGLPFNWRYGPSNRDLGSAAFETTVHAFAGIGRRPFAPVHVRGRRDTGDLLLSWIRRTRIGGDSWESAEVPLGEESESYAVDVLNGDTVVRTLTASSSAATYTAAEQVADFGTPPPVIAVRIYQLSASYGRGSPAAALV